MFNKPLIKYTLIFITVIVAGFGLYKVFDILFTNYINMDISIYSDCLPLSNAKVSFDGKLMGTTNSSGKIQFKTNYDNDKPEKQVKISVRGKQWMEAIILKEENIDRTQKRIIFFRQLSTDVMINSFPENISYSIMDMNTDCEVYPDQIGSSVKRMIIDRPYHIRYSLDPEYNSHLFETPYNPNGIEDEIKLRVYQLNIITDPNDLSYEIAKNGTTIDVGFGTDKYFYNSDRKLVIKPNQGEPVNVHLRDEWKYVKKIKGETIIASCSKHAAIRVSNSAAQWQIINHQTKDVIHSGQGNEVVDNLCVGKHLLKEQGSLPELREIQFIITNTTADQKVNLDLRRHDISVVPYPNNVTWEIRKNKSILKNGEGHEKVTGLIRGSYTARCKRPDGSQSKWKNFELIQNNQLVELECFVACTSPQINIQLTPVSVLWELEKSNDNDSSPWITFESGTGHGNITAETEQLYRLTARYNTIKRVSDVFSFTKEHKTCRETIDIDMESHAVLLDEACNNEDWAQVVTLTEGDSGTGALKCNHYLCLALAYSNDQNDEKALNFILDGWDQATTKSTCLNFHTDEEYIFHLLNLVENYGLDDEHIAEKDIQSKIETISKLPLQLKTELKALYVSLTLQLLVIMENEKTFSDKEENEEKEEKRTEYCYNIKLFQEGIERINFIMNEIGSHMYKNTVDGKFTVQINKAYKTFGCQ